MTDGEPIIVIGAGHNGLVCATKLARAGHAVTVLERRDVVGGMADTYEFAPGFRASGCAQFLYDFPTALIDDLRLGSLGLTMDPRPLCTVALSADRAPRVLGAQHCENLPDGDAEAWPKFLDVMTRLAGFVQHLKTLPPPKLHERERRDVLGLAQLGLALRRLGRDDMRDLLRLISSNMYDLLHEWFADDVTRAALGLDAVLGTHLGPRSPGTVLTFLHRHGRGFGACQPVGGLGQFSATLARSAEESGVHVRLSCGVRAINVDGADVVGVTLDDGNTLDARCVVSNADPKTTLLNLLGAQHLDIGFARRVDRIRANGTASRLHLALDSLPAAPQGRSDLLRHRLLVSPDLDHLERAFNPVKYGEASDEPALEIAVPTLTDPALAPQGKHVVSITAQYAPFNPEHGWSAAARQHWQARIIAMADSAWPGLSNHIVDAALLVPDDLAQRYGAAGGHWHHGELTLDQFLFTRPVAFGAHYAQPVNGLYLCSAGTHPGGHVSGYPGLRAAEAVLSSTQAGDA